MISHATDSGNFRMLLAATLVMAMHGGHHQPLALAAALRPGFHPLQAGGLKLARCSNTGPSVSTGKKLKPQTMSAVASSRAPKIKVSVEMAPSPPKRRGCAGEESGERQGWNRQAEAAHHHRHGRGQVIKRRIRIQPGEALPVVGHARRRKQK